MSYVYHPFEIAEFLSKANFRASDEQATLYRLWEDGEHISPEYRQDFGAFNRAVREILSLFSMTEGDMDELELLMQNMDANGVFGSFPYEHNHILRFLKAVRLELLYIPGRDCYKIKLRTLVKRFGFQRRTSKLLTNITRALQRVSLVPYLRGSVPCDLARIPLDAMVIIRLDRPDPRPVR